LEEVSPARLLYRGAEADILLGTWLGRNAVYKVRKRLHYRLPQLDLEIRRKRTAHEAAMLHASKLAGVESPALFCLDTGRSTIVMEQVEGPRMKDSIDSLGPRGLSDAFESLGAGVATLHASGIVHGDVTTANVILRAGGVVFLDFGLASRTRRLEDHAVDLRLIKETLVGAHAGLAETALDALFAGYSSVSGDSRLAEVRRQLRSIERRGRYARVV
jgi:TP53 regulating kinase and related kinases